MPGKIFINYRRDDERAMAVRIRDRLAQTFGDANVFMDVDNLRPGQRFDVELEKALNQTDIFLAVIGPRWTELLAERQASGERDYVREEIAKALERSIIVVPVLIEQTLLPPPPPARSPRTPCGSGRPLEASPRSPRSLLPLRCIIYDVMCHTTDACKWPNSV
jgi:hypothetical protein